MEERKIERKALVGDESWMEGEEWQIIGHTGEGNDKRQTFY